MKSYTMHVTAISRDSEVTIDESDYENVVSLYRCFDTKEEAERACDTLTSFYSGDEVIVELVEDTLDGTTVVPGKSKTFRKLRLNNDEIEGDNSIDLLK